MIKRFLFCLLLAGEITVAADVLWALFFEPMPIAAFALIFTLSLCGSFFVEKLSLGTIRRSFLVLLCFCIMLPALILGELVFYGKSSGYKQLDNAKGEVFSDKEVMIFAPHQDDELSMLSGTLPEYLRYGSNVRIVFVTNGDYLGLAQTRLQEALKVAECIGVPEENLIFLGYGDSWNIEGGLHIYNAPDDEPVQSYLGMTETYGFESHPTWTQGKSYTRRNMYEDIRDVILKYKPDVIFSMAFEPHGDHRATALFVEEAMAEILRMDEEYEPLFLESASYHTSYYGTEDFYSQNILSIPNPFESPYNEDMNVYSWQDRVRLPVDASTLSRGLFGCKLYEALSLHATQGCNLRAKSIISGDTVFWQRDTSSLSYNASIEVSSGEAAYLNNFKLLDSSNINSLDKPFEDLWLPTDSEKKATVSFREPVDIREIRLYDNPSLEDNVLKAKIVFDDGSWLETGELKINGSGTSVLVDKEGVSSFSVQLLETEGEKAGLSEIEVSEGEKDDGLNFVKIQNE
ncbi:MAG: PIG-L family deacetylase, partial [Oscillospiraceae bacterium]|nr:PIG-L family deacetylase [Oscillospiraceae bacterium]